MIACETTRGSFDIIVGEDNTIGRVVHDTDMGGVLVSLKFSPNRMLRGQFLVDLEDMLLKATSHAWYIVVDSDGIMVSNAMDDYFMAWPFISEDTDYVKMAFWLFDDHYKV